MVDLNKLKSQRLLKGLTDKELNIVREELISESYKANETIIEEGSLTTDLYLLVEGEVSILKWDENRKFQIPLGTLDSGEMFGEMSFMDSTPRSSSVKADSEVRVLKLSKERLLEGTAEEKEILSKIYLNIALVNINRLRDSNKIFEKNFRSHMRTFQFRQDMGIILIYQLIIMSFCAFLGAFFEAEERLRQYIPWIVGILPTSFLIKKFSYGRAHYGLNLYGWKKVIPISLGISLIIIALLTMLHYVFQTQSVEKWVVFWRHHRLTAPEIPLALNLILYFFFAFGEELVCRGVMQTTLQEFLDDSQGIKTVFLNAFLVSLLHLPFGYIVSINALFSSLLLGPIFLKQKTILGVFIIHFLVGFFILFV